MYGWNAPSFHLGAPALRFDLHVCRKWWQYQWFALENTLSVCEICDFKLKHGSLCLFGKSKWISSRSIFTFRWTCWLELVFFNWLGYLSDMAWRIGNNAILSYCLVTLFSPRVTNKSGALGDNNGMQNTKYCGMRMRCDGILDQVKWKKPSGDPC